MSPRARQGNRTDLTQEPVTAATGQEYGEASAQRQAEAAVPIGSTPTDAPPADMTADTTPRPAPKPQVQPGTLPWLHPTNRPDEPVTTGLPFGPGAGPEALHSPPPLVSDTLASLAASPHASASVAAMAAVAKSLGV